MQVIDNGVRRTNWKRHVSFIGACDGHTTLSCSGTASFVLNCMSSCIGCCRYTWSFEPKPLVGVCMSGKECLTDPA
jgi:hypothetical protein